MAAQTVLEKLLDQAKFLAWGTPLQDGRLGCFREALSMEKFPEVVQWIRNAYQRDLFSTVQEIEFMEECFRDGRRSEVIIQCCLIFGLSSRAGIFSGDHLLFWRASLFEQCRTLEEIADLLFRLDFIEETNALHEYIEQDVLYQAGLCMMGSEVTWEGILLLFKASHSKIWFRLFVLFTEVLRKESFDIPRPAATLLLSFICESVHLQQRSHGDQVILKLLSLGASLMISVDGHSALFRRLEKDHPLSGGRSWLVNTPLLEMDAAGLRPTALKRLLRTQWSAGFKAELSRRVCCSLDVSTPCNKTFPHTLPSLACLAAPHVKGSDLASLPPHMRFQVVKHRTPTN